MKSWLILMVFHSIFFCYSQDTTITYLDVNWKKAKVEEAKYKRVIVHVADDHYQVEDFLKNNQPVFKGQFKSEKIKRPFGEFVNFDDQGTIREVYHFNDDGELDQEYLVFDENGKKDSERFYSDGRKHGLWKWYYDNGSICWFEQWRLDTLVMLQQFSVSGEEYENLFNLQIAPKWNYDKKSLSHFLNDKLISDYEFQNKSVVLLVYIGSDGKVQRVDSKTKLDINILNAIEKLLIEGPIWLPALEHLRPVDGVLEIEITL